jgi:SAM-dependent methyltransferase
MTWEASLLADIERRRQLRQEVCDPLSKRHLAALEVGTNARCLEIGAGLGSIAAWLAERCGPDGLVVATELRDDLLRVLRAQNVPRLIVNRHDLTRDPLPADTYDLVHVRFVLAHLPTRASLIRQLAASAKPGGWVAIEEGSLVWGETPVGTAAWKRALAALDVASRARDIDYRWTMELPAALVACGLTDICAHTDVRLFCGGSVEALYWAASFHQLRQTVMPDEARDLEEAVEDLLQSRNWFSAPPVVFAAGRRPSYGQSA